MFLLVFGHVDSNKSLKSAKHTRRYLTSLFVLFWQVKYKLPHHHNPRRHDGTVTGIHVPFSHLYVGIWPLAWRAQSCQCQTIQGRERRAGARRQSSRSPCAG